MTLATSLRQLESQRTLLDEAVDALQVTLCEDRPSGAVPALVDRFENVVAELRGVTAELAACIESLPRQGQSIDSDQMREIHELLQRFARCYWHDLARYSPLRELLDMGEEQGRAWQAWGQVVRTAIEACETPFDRASTSLIECWSVLVERRSTSGTITNLAKLRVAAPSPDAKHE